MLDVHAPHETIHTWKNFLTHIAAIVVGLLIAVALEQTVEFFHHRHQREQLDAALRQDGEANRRYIEDDIVKAQAVMDWALAQATAVQRVGPTDTLIVHPMPPGFIGSPDAGVWPSAKASGVTNLLPSSEQNWLEYLSEEYTQLFVSAGSSSGQLYQAYAALDQALIGYATRTASGDFDLSSLPAAQRLTVTERLRGIAEAARGVMRRLVIYEAANEYILSTPHDQLDEPQAEARYARIYREKMDAYPGARFVLSGN
jgi:hypothetical protein